MTENSPETEAAVATRRRFQAEKLKPYVDWYWQDLSRLHRRYLWCFWFGLGCGFFATVLAALPKELANRIAADGDRVAGWLVVVLSALVTLTTGTLAPRYKRMLDDRDKGRIRLDRILAKLELKDYPDSLQKELSEIIDEIAAVETALGGIDRAATHSDTNSRNH
jgi:hypothetical protein